MLRAVGLRVDRARGLGGGGARPLRVSHTRWKVVVVSAAAKANVKPRIMRLRRDEVAQVLPWTGSGEQRLQKLGTPATWLTRLAISLAGSAVFYNFNTMAAAMASLYWAWDPLLSTTFANTSLRLQYPYAGLWRARVLSAKVTMPAPRPRTDDVFQEIFESSVRKPFLKLVIGDGSPATLEMKVALPGKKTQVQVGDTVEVLVLSDIKSLSRFMAVRDVYFPELGVWLSEDPCIERPVFEELIETLRAGVSSAAQGRDAQSVKARLPDSLDMTPASDLERPTARRWRVTQLDYEEFDNNVDEDPKLQALRRLSQAQNGGPRKQYMEMQQYSSDSEDIWKQDEDEDEKELKVQPPRTLAQEPKNLELQRNLRADAYGPPMQYMRVQEYRSEVEPLKEPETLVGDAPDDNAAEQLTTVDEFLGSEAQTKDVELVQEEEF